MRQHIADETFPTDTAGLPPTRRPLLLDLCDGDVLDLSVAPVAKRIGDATVRMLAYNGTVPGPTVRVPVGSEITVDVANHGDLETTVHWHGLRVDNRYDGVPYEIQAPVPVGGRFRYRVRFPDPGLYWYHPHVREDYGQELGLYGNILVVPAEPDYWPAADRELILTLDDLLLDRAGVVPFNRTRIDHAAMGRFGTVFLTGGDTDPRLPVRAGEVVRLWLTNTANARVFNVTVPGARMKLVGGDSGRVEREELVSQVLIGPSERAVVDVLFDRPGELALRHRMPDRSTRLARFTVDGSPSTVDRISEFQVLRRAPELEAERRRLGGWLAASPDKVLALVARMDHQHGHSAGHGSPDGIEWEDHMADANRASTPATVHWSFVDRTSGADAPVANWRFRVGERVKLRLVNELDSDHPMHHPFHVHGAGRFLVLARDGVTEASLVWKDTVLIRAGQTVDILLDVTNPGVWMAHCHIPEHMHSGMMFSFAVTE